MYTLFRSGSLLCAAVACACVTSFAQVIKFQSVGFAGTTAGVTGPTTKISSSFGTVVATGSSQANNAGFIFGSPDYKPSVQASGITFSALQHNQMNVTWLPGNGTRYIVVCKAGSAVTATPSSATGYTANTAFGSGQEIGASSGNFVVYDGTGTTTTISNLTPSTLYFVKVFAYNGKYGTNTSNIEYSTAVGANNPASRTSLPLPPTLATSGLTPKVVGERDATLQWINGNGSSRIIFMQSGATINSLPINGTSYTANSSFGSGDTTAPGIFAVYSGSGNIVTVTNLLPNTTYYFSISEFTGTGSQSNYLGGAPVSSFTTTTVAPTAVDPNNFAQTSFDANWNSVVGATGYQLDVAPDAAFNTYVAGFQGKVVAAGSLKQSVTGLTAGTNYFYRVRATNAGGASSNSNVVATQTVPAAPAFATSTNVGTSSFDINWTASSTATEYFIDVASDPSFVNFIAGYNHKSVGLLTTTSISGLSAGTPYYLRLQALNSSGTSPNSATKIQYTVTDAPKILAATNVTSSNFEANWEAASGATGYELHVSSDNFVTQVSGYPKLVSGLIDIVQGLSPATIYKYKVRGVNDGGVSAFSAERPLITANGSGAQVNLPDIDETTITTTDGKVRVKVNNGISPVTVRLRHRRITDKTFLLEQPVSLSNGFAEFVTSNDWSDELGMEFNFIATDAASRVDSMSARRFSYNSFQNAPIAPIDSIPGSYRMFSIPAALKTAGIENVLQSIFAQYGGYDRKKWRLFHFKSNQYIEFQAGLTSIDPGLSYWIITDDRIVVPVNDQVVAANQAAPFTLPVTQGWNQIANPYPYALDWSQLQAANPTVGLNSLWGFSSNGYLKRSSLRPWTGAFVFAESNGTITFPVTARTGAAREMSLQATLDEEIWQVPIQLTHGSLKQFAYFGMHPQASVSKDILDDITPPRFMEFLEWKSPHQEHIGKWFSIDMVPTASDFEWTWTAASNVSGQTGTISWDATELRKNSSSLWLVDQIAGHWIDMKQSDQYTFDWTDERTFKIIFNRAGELKPTISLVGEAYPNPFDEILTIPILCATDGQKARVEIYDGLGRRVRAWETVFEHAGENFLTWNGRDVNQNAVSPGIWYCKVSIEQGSTGFRRILKK